MKKWNRNYTDSNKHKSLFSKHMNARKLIVGPHDFDLSPVTCSYCFPGRCIRCLAYRGWFGSFVSSLDFLCPEFFVLLFQPAPPTLAVGRVGCALRGYRVDGTPGRPPSGSPESCLLRHHYKCSNRMFGHSPQLGHLRWCNLVYMSMYLVTMFILIIHRGNSSRQHFEATWGRWPRNAINVQAVASDTAYAVKATSKRQPRTLPAR